MRKDTVKRRKGGEDGEGVFCHDEQRTKSCPCVRSCGSEGAKDESLLGDCTFELIH